MKSVVPSLESAWRLAAAASALESVREVRIMWYGLELVVKILAVS